MGIRWNVLSSLSSPHKWQTSSARGKIYALYYKEVGILGQVVLGGGRIFRAHLHVGVACFRPLVFTLGKLNCDCDPFRSLLQYLSINTEG